MRYTGPRNRLARREGVDLGLKTPGSKSHARLLKKIAVPPGQHGATLRRKRSERGRQIRETQKLRFLFGVTARQLKNYFSRAVKTKGNTGLYLSILLESRLDNVIYRLGFAPTRAAARQYVSHGHVKVNNDIVTIPSYQTKAGDLISFANDKIQKTPIVQKMIEAKDYIVPGWLERTGNQGKIIQKPVQDGIKDQVDLRLVIEYFSR